MTRTVRTFTVKGVEFFVWSDFIRRETYAQNKETCEIKTLRSNGYIKAERTVKSHIKLMFDL